MRLRFLLLLGVALACIHGQAAPSTAASLGFECITHNDAGDCATGEAQLRVDVSDPGNGKVEFTFHNEGPKASAISHVFWDDDSLLAFSSILDGPGVAFRRALLPFNARGASGAEPHFDATWGLTVKAFWPRSWFGVNPGEILVVRLKLTGGAAFADVIQHLEDGRLRIAVQVQGFESCGAESFVNAPLEYIPVPEPGSFALLASGLLGLSSARRRTA